MSPTQTWLMPPGGGLSSSKFGLKPSRCRLLVPTFRESRIEFPLNFVGRWGLDNRLRLAEIVAAGSRGASVQPERREARKKLGQELGTQVAPDSTYVFNDWPKSSQQVHQRLLGHLAARILVRRDGVSSPRTQGGTPCQPRVLAHAVHHRLAARSQTVPDAPSNPASRPAAKDSSCSLFRLAPCRC